LGPAKEEELRNGRKMENSEWMLIALIKREKTQGEKLNHPSLNKK
jgi:hypothetical protein